MHQFPIPRITIFFAIGIALADHLRQLGAMPFCFGSLLLISVFTFIVFRNKETIASLSLQTSFILLGAFIMSADWNGKQISLPNNRINYTATITSTPTLKNNKYSCDITTTSFKNNYKLKAFIITNSPNNTISPNRTNVHLNNTISLNRTDAHLSNTISPNRTDAHLSNTISPNRTDAPLHIGDRLLCHSRWNTPRNFSNDSTHFNYALYLRRHGYAATTFITNPQKCDTTDRSLSLLPLLLREKLLNKLLSTNNENSNTNTNSNANQNANRNANTNTNSNANQNANRNANQNANRNANSNTNSNTNQNANQNENSNTNENTNENFSNDSQALAIISAMLLGDKTGISKETKYDYSAAGASHILALSGLHISILLSILSILLFGMNRKMSSAIQLLFVWSFAFLVGMPVSILRVAIMFTLLIAARALDRSSNSFNTLFVAAFLILLFSPQSLFDVGFQLSFTAVFFILLYTKISTANISTKIKEKHPKKLYVLNILLVSFAAQIGTLPLILYHFGQFPVYFLFTNIFIGLFATAILSLGILTLAVSFIPAAFACCQKALVFTASTMNGFTHFMATLPYSTVQNIYINEVQVCLCYLLIFLLISPFLSKKFAG